MMFLSACVHVCIHNYCQFCNIELVVFKIIFVGQNKVKTTVYVIIRQDTVAAGPPWWGHYTLTWWGLYAPAHRIYRYTTVYLTHDGPMLCCTTYIVSYICWLLSSVLLSIGVFDERAMTW